MKSHPFQVVTHITYNLSPFWLGYYFKFQDVKVTFMFVATTYLPLWHFPHFT
jgi:hypothetical protein